MNDMADEISRARDFLAAAYKKANALGIDVPHNATLIRRRIQRLTDEYNALSVELGPSGE